MELDSPPSVVSLKEKFSLFSEQWSPKIIAQLNDYHFKIVKVAGEFVWHLHEDTDEAFYVIEGELRIDFRDGSRTLQAGDLIVVPKGVEHRPVADKECRILVIEPAGTINTGSDVDSNLHKGAGEWLA